MSYAKFQDLIRLCGHELYRDMPWRRDTRPYYVLVSELMLQQTQVSRVIPKFETFVARFPDFETLSRAPLSEVVKLWSGLGYNRRAKYLHEAAKQIVQGHGGRFPSQQSDIMQLPGIGPATAGAIMAYAFNQPVVYIETNVRAVYFHHFFRGVESVSDSQLRPLIEATIDKDNPRRFYWALMDYGSVLKRSDTKGKTSQSRHYKKQSRLRGSVREVRGQIVNVLIGGDMAEAALESELSADERFEPALAGLIRDGLVSRTDEILHLTK